MVQDIITQAAEQVGYRPPKFAFDMQIMMLPDQGLLLTFSESDSFNIPGAKQLMEYLREMKDTLQRAKEELEQTGSQKDDKDIDHKDKKEKPGKVIFVFESISQVMSYASILPSNLMVHSALYEMDGMYYLYFEKGRAAYKRFSRACIQALEFGKIYGVDESLLLPMAEHVGCLIAERAVQKLQK